MEVDGETLRSGFGETLSPKGVDCKIRRLERENESFLIRV